MKNATRLSIATVALALLATAAPAQTLYKLVDKNGKVTYSESPPKDFDGKVIPLDIDPTRNTATMPKYTPPEKAKGNGISPPRSNDVAAVGMARERVDAARKALDDARSNPGEGDFDRIGTAGGGTRPVPSQSYLKRIEALEENLRKAEENLARLETRAR
jgi:uncharacterized protein DUF4124